MGYDCYSGSLLLKHLTEVLCHQQRVIPEKSSWVSHQHQTDQESIYTGFEKNRQLTHNR